MYQFIGVVEARWHDRVSYGGGTSSVMSAVVACAAVHLYDSCSCDKRKLHYFDLLRICCTINFLYNKSSTNRSNGVWAVFQWLTALMRCAGVSAGGRSSTRACRVPTRQHWSRPECTQSTPAVVQYLGARPGTWWCARKQTDRSAGTGDVCFLWFYPMVLMQAVWIQYDRLLLWYCPSVRLFVAKCIVTKR